MQNILLITQVVLSFLLMIFILIQNKEGGLNAVMGGGEGFQSTRRGPEKVIFNLTIFFAFLFVLNALLINLI